MDWQAEDKVQMFRLMRRLKEADTSGIWIGSERRNDRLNDWIKALTPF